MVGFMDVLSGALNVIDLPRSSAVDLLMGENPIDQWADPFGTTGRRSGRDLLTKWGLTSANKETGMSGWLSDPMEGVADVAGFAVDAIIDPLNAIPVGRLFSALKGRRVASARNRRIDALRGHPERQRVVSEMSDALREQLGPVTAAQQSQDLADLADAAILHKELDPDRVYGQLQVRGPSSPVANTRDASGVTLEYPWKDHWEVQKHNEFGRAYPEIGLFVNQASRSGVPLQVIARTLTQGGADAGFVLKNLGNKTEAEKALRAFFAENPTIGRKRSIPHLPDSDVIRFIRDEEKNRLMVDEVNDNPGWRQIFTPEELAYLRKPVVGPHQIHKRTLIDHRLAQYEYDDIADLYWPKGTPRPVTPEEMRRLEMGHRELQNWLSTNPSVEQMFTPQEMALLQTPATTLDELASKKELVFGRREKHKWNGITKQWEWTGWDRTRGEAVPPTAADGPAAQAAMAAAAQQSVTEATPKNPIEAVLPDPAPMPVETPAAPTTRPVRKPRVKKPEDPLDAAIRAVNASLRRENIRGEQQLSDIVDTALSGVSSTEARRLLRPKPNPGVQDLTVAFQPDDTVLNPVTQKATKADPELERLEAALRPRQEAMQAERRAAQEAAKQAAAARRMENKIDTQRGSAARAVAAELRREQADFASDAALAAQINATQAQRGAEDAIESLVGGLTPTESRQLANSRLRSSDYNQVDPEITIHPRSVSMTADRRRLIRPMRGFAAKIDGEWAVPAMAEQSDYWPVYSTPEQARDAALQIVEGMRQSRANQASAFAPSTPATPERPMSPVGMVASPEQASAVFPEEIVRAPNAYGRVDMSFREPQGLTGDMVFGSQANPATAPHELVHWLRGDVFANQNMVGSMQQQKAIEEQVADAIEAALLQGVNTSSPALQGPLSRLQRNMQDAYQSGGAMMPQRLMQASPRARQAFGELFGVTRSRSPLDRSELPSLMSPIGQYLLQQAAGRFNQYGGVQ
jgi:hypothetical protein